MNILKRTTAKVNTMIELNEINNIIQTNNIIKAAGVWVADQLGLKMYEGGKKKDPWKKDVLKKIQSSLIKDMNILERVKKDKLVQAKRVILSWLRKSTE